MRAPISVISSSLGKTLMPDAQSKLHLWRMSDARPRTFRWLLDELLELAHETANCCGMKTLAGLWSTRQQQGEGGMRGDTPPLLGALPTLRFV